MGGLISGGLYSCLQVDGHINGELISGGGG